MAPVHISFRAVLSAEGFVYIVFVIIVAHAFGIPFHLQLHPASSAARILVGASQPTTDK